MFSQITQNSKVYLCSLHSPTIEALTMAEPKMLPTAAIPHFEEGISLILSKWWALQMAVQNEWGGRNSHSKALDFASDIFNFFHKPNRREPIYLDDLESLLAEGLITFNTVAEDGSIEDVAVKLMELHEECLDGNFQSILRLKQLKPLPIPRVEQDASDSDDANDEDDECMGNDEDSYMMVDTPESLPSTNPTDIPKNNSKHQHVEEAEDGWTRVSSRKGKGRKN